jgi:acyl-CoA reductase-like NAD-dependent aldehyde dehydrogenase
LTGQVQTYDYFVNGKWASGFSVEKFELRNPATDEVIGRIPRAVKADVGEAVEEVVRMANESQFGLYGGVWTNNLKLANQLVSRLQAGVVAVNDYLVAYSQTPFGGYKDSGIGYERVACRPSAITRE